jgi:hypothetical protein
LEQAMVRHVVDDSELKVYVDRPGFHTEKTLLLVVTIPAAFPLELVEVAGDSRMIVEAPVGVVRNAGSGFVRVERTEHMDDVMKLELLGSGPMLFCAPHNDPLPMKRLQMHNLGSSHMLVRLCPRAGINR